LNATGNATSLQDLLIDLRAALIVSLISIPLCLGVAMACGLPIETGLLAAAVGGLIFPVITRSKFAIVGPSASLVALISLWSAELRGLEYMLIATVLAGCFQLLFCLIRFSAISNFFPASVISGVVCALGIDIVLKQIPHALGTDRDFEGDLSFWQFGDQQNSFSEISTALANIDSNVALIFAVSIATMLLASRRSNPFRQIIPPGLLAIAAGCLTNLYLGPALGFALPFPEGSTHLVSFGNLDSQISFDASRFWQVFSGQISGLFSAAILIAIVSMLESLVGLEAMSKLDPERNLVNPERNLLGLAAGNIASGLIGGLPVSVNLISSSVNVYARPRSILGPVISALMIAAVVLSTPAWVGQIPFAALAAVLIMLGIQLIGSQPWNKNLSSGIDQSASFVITILAVLFTDPMVGTLIGAVISIAFIAYNNSHRSITMVQDQNFYFIRFTKDVSFVNKGRLKELLISIPNGSSVLLDGSSAVFIDRDIFDLLQDFEHSAKNRQIKLEIRNMSSKTVELPSLGKLIGITSNRDKA
jgi:MFS superfamily sulfate permease-like transporter